METLIEQFNSLDRLLEKAKNPLLIIHPKPDADALGSSFAFAEYLEKRLEQEKIDIYCADKPSEALSVLFNKSKITTNFTPVSHDLLFIMDRGDVFRKLGIDTRLEEEGLSPKIINIDHHPHTSIEGALNIIDTTAPATSEIIFRYFDHIDHEINSKSAQYLLNGIFADTGGFRHNNTTPRSLEIASNLMRKGATISKVNRALFANKSLNTLKLWAIALERARINPKTGMAVSFITKKDLESCNATAGDLDGISEILNSISESKFSLILSEREQDKIKASLRSETYKGIDVSKIAREFKGGGHKLASGFEIKGKLRQVGDSWVIE